MSDANSRKRVLVLGAGIADPAVSMPLQRAGHTPVILATIGPAGDVSSKGACVAVHIPHPLGQ